MIRDNEIDELMQSIAQKGNQLLITLKDHSEKSPINFDRFTNILRDYQLLLEALSNNPEKVWMTQMNYWQEATILLQKQLDHWLSGSQMPIEDKRFKRDEWVNNPFFNLLSQQYLLADKHFNNLLDHLDFAEQRPERRVRFFGRQVLEALSPDNYIPTNPELLAETIKTNGKNLLRGLNNFLNDIESGSLQLVMTMTDMEAFKIGENIAITPGKVIYKNDLMELIQYTPTTEKVKATPLLIIPPWINKYYILDLSPNNSLVRWLVAQGITVFVISWVNPDQSHAKKGLYSYMKEGPMTAIEIIQKQLKVTQVNALGFCIGGTLLTTLLGYYKAKAQNPIRSATFLATLIDFSDPGDIQVYIDKEQVERLEIVMKKKGYLEGQYMANVFNSLRATDLIWSFFIKHYLRGQSPVPFDILFWNADATNMPAKMHSEYLHWMYLNNDLIKPGKIRINKTPIDVSKIDIPTCFVSTQKDHIAPWETTFRGYQTVSGPKQFILGGSGHIAGIINPPEAKKYGFYTNSTADNAREWLMQATPHKGSWWPEWLRWLKKQSGRSVEAPNLDALPYQPIMDAPGEYVFKKSVGGVSDIKA